MIEVNRTGSTNFFDMLAFLLRSFSRDCPSIISFFSNNFLLCECVFVCVCVRFLAETKVRLCIVCKVAASVFHHVSMCPQTSCWGENKCSLTLPMIPVQRTSVIHRALQSTFQTGIVYDAGAVCVYTHV